MATILEHPTLKRRKSAQPDEIQILEPDTTQETSQRPQQKNTTAIEYSKAFRKWEPPSFRRTPSVNPSVTKQPDAKQTDAIEEFLTEILPEGSPLSSNPLFIKAVQRRLLDKDDE